MRIALLFLLCLECSGQVTSLFTFDERYLGTSVMPFLELPVGARSAGLGGNGVSLLDDPSVVFLNPACMAGIADNGVLFSHEEMYFGLRHEYAGWMHPTFRYGTFGAQWNMLRSGDIQNARDIDEKPVSASTADMSLGAAYAKGLLDNHLLLGFNLQFLQSRLGSATGRGFAGDVGVSARLPLSIRTSLAVKNIGTGITYNALQEDLPAGFIWDVAADFLQHKIGVTAGVKKYTDSPLKISAGIEGVIHPALCLRLGYEHAMQDDEQQEALKGLSAGLGLRYGIFRADYAYSRRGEFLGGIHSFNAGFIFGRLVPLNDMDYFKKAQQLFKQARYEKCVSAAQDALKINPNLWQAHLLIEEAIRMMRVRDKTLIAVFYTGDTRGAFVPTSEHGLGGLARRGGVLKSLQEDYPLSVTVDAGNFLTGGMEKAKWEIGYRLLGYMNVTAANFGNGEYALGVDTVLTAADKAGLPCLSANLEPRLYEGKITSKTVLSVGGKYAVTIIGVLKPVKKIGKLAVVGEPVPALAPLVEEVRKKSDLVILLSTGDLDECKAYASAVKGIDVIVCGDGSPATYTPQSAGRTLIVSAGPGGENLGFLSLQFSPNRKLLSFANRIIPLDPAAPEDGQVARALRRMVVKSDSELPDPKLLPSPYILPIISNFDMTVYHYHGPDSATVDSMVSAWPDSIRMGSLNMDSLREIARGKDLMKAREFAAKQGFRGLATPDDTTDQVYLQFVLTGKTRRISWNHRRNHDPLLNYEGSAVLYYSDTLIGKVTYDGTDKRKAETDLFVYDLPYDYTVRVLPENGQTLVSAAWAADGNALYTVEQDKAGKQEIYLKSVGKKIKFNVSRTPGASEYDVAVSPDARNIAYTSDREEGVQIYISDPMGNNPIRATFGSGFCSKPVYSATGRYLAYACSRTGKGDRGDLLVLDLRTNQLDTLSQNQNIYDIVWNGDKELYIAQGINYSDINVVDLKSRAARRLTQRETEVPQSEEHPVLFDTGNGVLVYFEAVLNGSLSVMFTQGEEGEVKKAFSGPGAIRLK